MDLPVWAGVFPVRARGEAQSSWVQGVPQRLQSQQSLEGVTSEAQAPGPCATAPGCRIPGMALTPQLPDQQALTSGPSHQHTEPAPGVGRPPVSPPLT